jgi:NAD-dependent dihydropyrimidine dehydrogenase PreA subunit
MKQQYLKNTSTLKLYEERCTGCGMCLEVCPHSVFEMDGKKVTIADKDRCMECSACALNCPFGALEVRKGVGCAAAVIRGLLKGNEPSCGCS